MEVTLKYRDGREFKITVPREAASREVLVFKGTHYLFDDSIRLDPVFREIHPLFVG